MTTGVLYLPRGKHGSNLQSDTQTRLPVHPATESAMSSRSGNGSSARVLEKDRNLRYQNASDIVSDLQRLKRDLDSGARSSAISRRASPLPIPRFNDSLAVLPFVNATGDPETEYLSDSESAKVSSICSPSFLICESFLELAFSL